MIHDKSTILVFEAFIVLDLVSNSTDASKFATDKKDELIFCATCCFLRLEPVFLSNI